MSKTSFYTFLNCIRGGSTVVKEFNTKLFLVSVMESFHEGIKSPSLPLSSDLVSWLKKSKGFNLNIRKSG
jgi:hypothetical protein